MSGPGHGDRAGQAGRIVAAYGRRVVVETPSGQRFPCRLYGRCLRVVCGDQVRWTEAEAEGAAGLVLAIERRSCELARVNATGNPETVVANLDQLVAILAPVPAPDFALCDRYLAAAEWAGLQAAIAFNKSDLPGAVDPHARSELATYRALGYPVTLTSKHSAAAVAELGTLLRDRVSILVGQSGVGKSSLLNLLVPGVEATVREVSRATAAGCHTTTASALFHLPGGGGLIDSPGVRDFAPPLPSPRDVATGFREIIREAAGCRFLDCLHAAEPGCAVQAATDAGRVSPRRLASYRQLLRQADDFEQRTRKSGKARGPSGAGRGFRR